ncbi:DUF6538 domain-containing protein [Vibrio sp. ABG19]|uniref:DUF6538 domain-containing protein n=1 Tax=Vibrio sp. ABG19 TaxID=2817385 RepID=UPI00249DEA8D|nr:DUF6538 domain-containing protein [Vibrio sp. ABG19]WGY46611.1 hypothetical protein J0X00_17565 [Vibrio sp. ABG19]
MFLAWLPSGTKGRYKWASSPHKHPRTGVHFFRRGVPKELRDTIGKIEFKTSLRTKNLKDAKRLFPAYLEEAQKQIELAKLKLLGSSDIELNAIECAIIAERWYEHVKADLDATGAYRDVLKLTRDTDGSIHEFGLSDTLPLSGYEIETATNSQLQELAEHLKEFMLEQLDREGLVVSILSDSFRRLAVAFYHYVHRLEALCRARHKRDFGYNPISTSIAGNPLSVSSPTVKQVSTSPRGAQNPISKVFARYVESATLRGKAPQSLSEYGLQIDRLIEVIGDIDVTVVA